MENPTLHYQRGATDALHFQFDGPADALRLALRLLNETYQQLPDHLPTEERLKLYDLLIDGTYLRLNLFLGSDQDKAEVERELDALESDDLEEGTEDGDLPEPSLN